MGSRKDPERAAKREKLTALLQQLDVNSMQDFNDLFKDMIGAFLENGSKANSTIISVIRNTIIATSPPTTAGTALHPRNSNQATAR